MKKVLKKVLILRIILMCLVPVFIGCDLGQDFEYEDPFEEEEAPPVGIYSAPWRSVYHSFRLLF